MGSIRFWRAKKLEGGCRQERQLSFWWKTLILIGHHQVVTLRPAALLPSCTRVWKFPPRIPLLCSSSAGAKQLIVVINGLDLSRGFEDPEAKFVEDENRLLYTMEVKWWNYIARNKLGNGREKKWVTFCLLTSIGQHFIVCFVFKCLNLLLSPLFLCTITFTIILHTSWFLKMNFMSSHWETSK